MITKIQPENLIIAFEDKNEGLNKGSQYCYDCFCEFIGKKLTSYKTELDFYPILDLMKNLRFLMCQS